MAVGILFSIEVSAKELPAVSLKGAWSLEGCKVPPLVAFCEFVSRFMLRCHVATQ